MRPTTRLLASIRQTLEPGNPTGLTGLHTLPAPRSTLIHLYSNTLSQLSKIPASSIYRQSTEALTKQRLAVVQAHKPPGFDAWQDRVSYQIDKYRQDAVARGESAEETLSFEGSEFVMAQMGENEVDERDVQWEGTIKDKVPRPWLEGPISAETKEAELKFKAREAKELKKQKVIIEPEPPFTMDQYVLNPVRQRAGKLIVSQSRGY